MHDCDLDSRDCNEYAYEKCIGSGGRGICKCDENSIYVNGRCVLKADEPCTSPPADTWSLVPQECSPLSKCTKAGTCKCEGYLEPNKNGLCKVMHNGNCDLTGNLPCDDGRFLNCINSKCSCGSGALYEEAEDSCVLEANRQCDPLGAQKCTKYSSCELVREGNGAGNYFCICRTGLIENSKKECVIPYGDECGGNGDALCNEDAHQVCSGTTIKRCTCKNPDHSLYDPQTKSCYLLATAPCEPGEMPCVANAECWRGNCFCKDGLRHNSEGKCVLNHGMQCNEDNSLCDPTTFLACIPNNGSGSTCQCASKDAVFDGTTCRLKANSPCDPLPGKQQCVDLAQCDQLNETCQCKSSISGDSNLIANKVGECVRRYNSRCNIPGETEGDCDRDFGFQTCDQTNTCVCLEPENMAYNSTDGRCYGLKNKPCTENTLCEAGLACVGDTCSCDSRIGLVEDENGDCVRVPGSSCSDSDPFGKCSEKAYMSCVQNVCRCKDGYIQTGQGLDAKCVGNYNSPCSTNANCNFNGSLVCNTNDKCDCAGLGDQEYDRQTQHCWTMLYGRCHISRNFIGEDEVPLDCNEELNLACKRVSENDGGNYGVCRCADKYSEIYGICTGGSASFTGVALIVLLMSVFVVMRPI
ncbi:unnamed protein product [Allacma fusca]|uniref:Uncharacterized protein n=1 Tax=Allacma fusca TaxID=39272 RepID=A0A8J2KV57_9HEXA|nr:unnamed protein product [Allacma fusca]